MTRMTLVRAALSMPLLLLAACSGGDPALVPEGGDTRETSGIYGGGVVLATVQASDELTIEVVEYGDGLIGVAEWHGPGFDPTSPLSMANFRGRTIAEFYERVAGHAVDREVLERLKESGALATEAARVETAEAAVLAEGGAPDSSIRTLSGLACAQDALYYQRYAAGWGTEYCKNPPGWEDAWCKTNAPVVNKDWTHGERWMVRAQNMSLCNTARLSVVARWISGNTMRNVPLLSHTLGLNQGGMWWWEVSDRNWRYKIDFTHQSGNEQAHLNLANYRQW